MIRLGLCCIFRNEPIRFRTTKVKFLKLLNKIQSISKISEISLFNCRSLLRALIYCNKHNIHAFRIQSGLFPLRTHHVYGYNLQDLPDYKEISNLLDQCKAYSQAHQIRTSFHPDQFVVLNSPRAEVVHNSILELEHHGEMARRLGADVINIHAGGLYGDKKIALERFISNFKLLSGDVKRRLTIENDDRSYTPVDLLPLCWEKGIPLVYDVHHHRCLPDEASIAEATNAALTTWNREPLFHISSPRNGWDQVHPERHSDYIDFDDFPDIWKYLDITVDVEAKAKELAVIELMAELV